MSEITAHCFADAVREGATLLRAKRARVAKICENARWLTFSLTTGVPGARICREIRLPVVNTAWDFYEIGEYLCARFPEALAGGYYFDRSDGLRQWGFRSRGDFDVSALCKRYGGGGHAGAAGFQSAIGWLPETAA